MSESKSEQGQSNSEENEDDEKEYECVRCGIGYEPYEVFVRDDFSDIVEHQRVNDQWELHEGDRDGFCKPCRMAVTNYGAYLTKSEREELEPKTDLDVEPPNERYSGGSDE